MICIQKRVIHSCNFKLDNISYGDISVKRFDDDNNLIDECVYYRYNPVAPLVINLPEEWIGSYIEVEYACKDN